MTKLPRCACCDGTLEPAQQLRFLVETDTLDDPAHLARIRLMPSVNGRPVPVCCACQERVQGQPALLRKPRAAGMFGLIGALSVGLLLSSLFTSRG